jgi:hypothetical protein
MGDAVSLTCTVCPDGGKYLTDTSDTDTCVSYPADQNQPHQGQTGYTDRVVNTYNALMINFMSSLCLTCGSNTASAVPSGNKTSCTCNNRYWGLAMGDAVSLTCTVCPDGGKYLTDTSDTDTCVSYPADQNQPHQGQTGYTDRVVNTYNALMINFMSSLCLTCGSNTASAVPSGNKMSCTCNNGYWGLAMGDAVSLTCTVCPDGGKYLTDTSDTDTCVSYPADQNQPHQGQTGYTDRVVNTYNALMINFMSSLCLTCGSNTASAVPSGNKTSCTCNNGYWGLAMGDAVSLTCTVCPYGGKYLTDTSDTDTCVSYPADQNQPHQGQTGYTDRVVNTYNALMINFMSSLCLTCGSNTASAVPSGNKMSCTCNNGYWGLAMGDAVSLTCTVCPDGGKYLTDTSDTDTCVSYPADQNQPHQGQTGYTDRVVNTYNALMINFMSSLCLTCGSNTASAVVSGDKTSCTCNNGYWGLAMGDAVSLTCTVCPDSGKYTRPEKIFTSTNCPFVLVNARLKYSCSCLYAANVQYPRLLCIFARNIHFCAPPGLYQTEDCGHEQAETWQGWRAWFRETQRWGTWLVPGGAEMANLACKWLQKLLKYPSPWMQLSHGSNKLRKNSLQLMILIILVWSCSTVGAASSVFVTPEEDTSIAPDKGMIVIQALVFLSIICTLYFQFGRLIDHTSSKTRNKLRKLEKVICLIGLATNVVAVGAQPFTTKSLGKNKMPGAMTTSVTLLSEPCNAGYTGPNGGTCVACPAGKYKIGAGDAACSDCETGKYLETEGATQESSCVSCPASSSSAAASTGIANCLCNAGHTGPNGGTCVTCAAGKYKIGAGDAACSDCGAGKYLETEGATQEITCVSCPASSSSAAASTAIANCLCNAGHTGPNGGTCVACAAGKYKISAGDAACSDCISGKYLDTEGATQEITCVSCPASSSSAAASTILANCLCNAGHTGPNGGTCVACATGKYKIGAGNAACSDCGAGKYLETEGATQDSCVSCPGSSSSATASTVIANCLCNAGHTGPNGGTCVACVAGKYKIGAGDAACTNCGAGKYLETEGATQEISCVSCPGSSNSAAASTTIENCLCNAGHTGPNGGTCVACAAGKYKISPGDSTCTNCGTGKYLETEGATQESSCVSCPAFSSSTAASTILANCLCNAGHTGPNGGTCVACAAGKYKIGAGDASCSDCGAGKYLDGQGATQESSCVSCPASSSSAAASTGIANCLCNAGHTGPNGGTCVACAAGKYKIGAGDAACNDCLSGKYLETEGATQEITCVSCPASSNSAAASTAIANCLCNAGHTGPNGGTCIACAAGKYKISAGDAACSNCGAGKYLETEGATQESSCVSCPGSSSSAAATTAISNCLCNAGHTGPNGGTCVACAAGKYKIGVGDAACIDCNVGKYLETEGATQESSCVSCPESSNSAAASNTIANCLCNAGHTGPNGGTCVACPAGKYKIGAGDAVCSDCISGKYLETQGVTQEISCVSCPASSSSAAASTAIANCLCNAGHTGPNGGTCIACATGKYKIGAGDAACSDCGTGKYLDTQGATQESSCVSCPASSSSATASTTIENCLCNAGHTGPNGGTCVACATGKYKIGAGDAACSDCGAGKYLETEGATQESSCVSCPGSSNSAAASTAITNCLCNAGHTGPNGGTCVACAAGKYKIGAGDAACSDCLSGKYLETEGATQEITCVNCPASSNSAAASTAIANCLCNAGHTGPNGGTCVPCAAGKYKIGAGDAACSNCGAGKYLETEGATQEIDCVSCPGSSSSAAASTTIANCLCNAGHTGPNGGTCVACAAGKYKISVGDVACSNCGTGKYLDTQGASQEISCVSCPASSSSAAASTTIENCLCNAGHTGPNGGTCVACAPGKYKIGAGDAACSDCGAGKYLETEGATQESSCVSCPGSSSSAAASTAITNCLCNAGHTGPNGGTCVACATGKYKIGAGDAACNDCLSGKYLETEGATQEITCVSCPASSSSAAASTAIANCLCNAGHTGPNGGTCVACAAGKYKIGVGDAACSNCGTGKYLESEGATQESSCVSCPGSSSSAAASTGITNCLCNAGHTGPNGGTCVACATGKYKIGAGDAACNDCLSGKYLETEGATQEITCVSCPASSSSAAASTAIANCLCNAGHTGPNGGTCVACATGKYKIGAGDAACSNCGTGKYLDIEGATQESSCVSCPASSNSAAASTGIANCLCNAGHTGPNGGTCVPCGLGKYLETEGATQESSCVSCPESSSSAAASTTIANCLCNAGHTGPNGGTCVACAVGKYKIGAGDAACSNCLSGKYLETEGATQESSCVSCPGSSNSAAASTAITNCLCNAGHTGPNGGTCVACATGKYKIGAGAAACSDCGAGKYLDTQGATQESSCVSCPGSSSSTAASTAIANCLCDAGHTGPNGGTCVACATGKYKIGAGAAACSNCGTGKYLDTEGATQESSCVSCPASSSSVAASTGITNCLCNAGHTGPNGGTCVPCGLGKYLETEGATQESSCVSCPESSSSAAASTTIANCLCNAGHTGPNGGTCVACAVGKYKIGAGDATCSNCLSGKYLETEGATEESSCVSCPGSSNSAAASTAITNCLCNAGHTGPNGGTCVACATGKYKIGAGDAACSDCGAGKYLDTQGATQESSCVSCPGSSNSAAASTAIANCLCNAGHTGPNGGTCVACATGKYKIGAGDAACSNCGTGKYLESEGATQESSCVSCPGSSSSTAASTAITNCLCDAGHTGPNGGTCVACAAGKYKIGVGDAACSNCLSGKYLETEGATQESSCVSCPGSSNSAAASTAITNCLCNAGHTGPNGGTCVACATGKYKIGAGDAACSDCGAGKYLDTQGATQESSCVSCPGSSSSTAASTAIANCLCDAGHTGPNGGTCVACAAGKYKIGAGDAACSNCGTGKYLESEGATQESSCVSCPGSSSSAAASTGITNCLCDAGHTGPNGGTCVACATGKYKIGAGAAACSNCGTGKYLDTEGATQESSCVSCPASSNSAAASTGIANCLCNAGHTGPNGGTCVPCGLGKYLETEGATQESSCVSCPESSSSAAASTTIANCLCNAGHTGPNGGTCVACAVGKYKIGAGDAACSNCLSGKYLETEGATEESSCVSCPGSSNSAAASTAITNCLCNAGHTGPNGGTCIACATGKYKIGAGDAACSDCGAGKYLDTQGATQESSCVSCPGSSSSTAASTAIANCLCDAGHTGPNGGTCVACAAGKYKIGAGDAACSNCGTGKYLESEGATQESSCVSCPGSSSSAAASTGITNCLCDAGHTGPNGGTCVACATGKYKIGAGAAACSDCGAGKYLDTEGATQESSCVSCPGSSSSATASTGIANCLCNAGHTGPNGGTCVACATGKYKISAGAAACNDCGTGKYLETEGVTQESSCVSCPASSSSAAASTVIANCLCNAGHTGPNGGTCVACAAGKYKISAGNAACSDCGAGKYLETQGSTQESSCVSCPASSSSATASTVIDNCLCNAGHTGPNGGTCVACAPGKYKIGVGDAACSNCGTGKYLDTQGVTQESSCVSCPGSSSSAAASTAIENCLCNAGHTGPNGGTCVACAAGKYKIGAGDAACSNCGTGKYLDTQGATQESSCVSCPGSSNSATASTAISNCLCNAGHTGPNGGTCVACGLGKYLETEGATQESSCVSCPASSSSAAASTSIDNCLCNAGHTGPNGGTCVACAAGKYKIGVGDAACSNCGAGKYLETEGATQESSCVSCPASSSSAAASTAITNCLCNAGHTGPNGGTCVVCSSGKYLETQGATQESSCVSCPASSNSAPGSTAIANCLCNAGHTGPNGGTCVACAAGKYKIVAGDAACRDCGAGKVSAVVGAIAASTCADCGAGKYSDVTDSTICFDCVAGKVSAAVGASAASTCADCGAGKYSDVTASTVCLDCVAGKLSSTGASICSETSELVPLETQFFITMSVTMPYSKANFNSVEQVKFKNAMAFASGTSTINVEILSIVEGRRRAGNVIVDTKIRAADMAGMAGITESLGSGDVLQTKINAELKKQGLKEATGFSSLNISSPASSPASVSKEKSSYAGEIAGGILGFLVVVALSSLAFYLWRRSISKVSADQGDFDQGNAAVCTIQNTQEGSSTLHDIERPSPVAQVDTWIVPGPFEMTATGGYQMNATTVLPNARSNDF